MLSLRSFMFEHVYLAPVTVPEHERAHADDSPDLSSIWWTRGDDEEEIVEFIAGMTDRFALSYAAAL